MDKMLKEAVVLLRQHDRIRDQLRDKEAQLREFCRKYEQTIGCRGVAPIHLRTMIDYQSKKANP